MPEYILRDGTYISKEEVKVAFEEGRAVLIHGWRFGGIATDLMLDGCHFDTRGECAAMYEEAWTTKPRTLREALNAARIPF